MQLDSELWFNANNMNDDAFWKWAFRIPPEARSTHIRGKELLKALLEGREASRANLMCVWDLSNAFEGALRHRIREAIEQNGALAAELAALTNAPVPELSPSTAALLKELEESEKWSS